MATLPAVGWSRPAISLSVSAAAAAADNGQELPSVDMQIDVVENRLCAERLSEPRSVSEAAGATGRWIVHNGH